MEENLTQMAYRKLKQMIMNYQLIPGQRLILSDLAGQLGVSRTPVNNALSILANEGFLDFVHNQGYKVHHINKTEAESLYEIFEIIALGSVGQAIRKLSPLKLANLDEKKKAYEQAVTERVTRGRFSWTRSSTPPISICPKTCIWLIILGRFIKESFCATGWRA